MSGIAVLALQGDFEAHARVLATLDRLGARMKCDKCGKRPERYYPANQIDTPGFVRRI